MTYRFLLGNLAAALLLVTNLHAQTPNFAALNQAFGIPIWVDDNLWDDTDADVATRLRIPQESRTSADSSYRVYTGSSTKILGARPFSVAFYGRGGKADRFSMVFANKGDLGEVDPKTHRVSDDYKKQIVLDARAIEANLTAVLGKPKVDQFGQGAKTREQVERWDWNGHTILLAAPRGEYVAVRIVPTANANGEATARITDAELSEQLKARIEKRPNGDVVLKDIPMVDQGPKGYCVPATYERALRYMGIPADMYVLAMAGQTEAGGGTSLREMAAGAAETVARSGRRMISSGGRITTQSVARFIDAGLPILWAVFVVDDLEKGINNRTVQRRSVTDWAAYKQMLKATRLAARHVRTNPEDGHMRLITGYNANTGEIAISDSWGPSYTERWITEDEANAISQGSFTIIGK
ncbi:MAG TPA: hypothetical protein VNB29_07260 [Chthoniobacterales bacterium]|jgi:hypothetical protein|nr:hypothetical protein [Chthoniobacterales bacterium]